MERRVTAAFNKRLEIVVQELRRGLEPELGTMTGPLRNELEAVFNAHVKRVFATIYEYNNARYKNLDSKADGDAVFGYGFGNSAELDALIAEYLQGRRSYLSNMSQGYGRAIIRDVLRLREEGNNLPQISKQIRTKYRGINKSRAATIARTETHSATGAAQDNYHRSVASNYGIIMKKQWVSTSDARTRRNHSAMNGTIVEMDEDFLMPDGARMKHVGDPRGGAANVVNCRCVILYVDADDEIEETAVVSAKEEAKELSLERVLDDLSDDEAIELSTSVSRFNRDYRGPKHLGHLYKRQKYDGLPKVVSTADFDAIESTIYYRGISGIDGDDLKYAEAFKRGDYFVGEGLYGNGTYTAFGANALDVANDYSRGGVVLRMKLSSSAKIIKYKDLEQRIKSAALGESGGELGAYKAQLEKRLEDINDRLAAGLISEEEHALQLKVLAGKQELATDMEVDAGAIATRLGYDAIHVEGQDYMIILNRTALVIDEGG